MAREGQGYPCYQHDMMMMIYILVWFPGISTTVGYLMPNPIYTYILNSYKLTKLNGFKYCYVSLTIQLNISYLFTYS